MSDYTEAGIDAKALNEQAISLVSTILNKHTKAILEEVREQIVSRNQRIAALEAENLRMATQGVALGDDFETPRMTNARLHGCVFNGWQCFHCGEVFTTVGAAEDHFGGQKGALTGCQIKAGDERGLLMKVRALEAENLKLTEDRRHLAPVYKAQDEAAAELGWSRTHILELEAEVAALREAQRWRNTGQEPPTEDDADMEQRIWHYDAATRNQLWGIWWRISEHPERYTYWKPLPAPPEDKPNE